jgi:hypothetical protein
MPNMGTLLSTLFTLLLDLVMYWWERILSGDAFRRERS